MPTETRLIFTKGKDQGFEIVTIDVVQDQTILVPEGAVWVRIRILGP